MTKREITSAGLGEIAKLQFQEKFTRNPKEHRIVEHICFFVSLGNSCSEFSILSLIY